MLLEKLGIGLSSLFSKVRLDNQTEINNSYLKFKTSRNYENC